MRVIREETPLRLKAELNSPGTTQCHGGALPYRRGIPGRAQDHDPSQPRCATAWMQEVVRSRSQSRMVDDTTSSKPFTAARDGFSINAGVNRNFPVSTPNDRLTSQSFVNVSGTADPRQCSST